MASGCKWGPPDTIEGRLAKEPGLQSLPLPPLPPPQPLLPLPRLSLSPLPLPLLPLLPPLQPLLSPALTEP